MNRRRPRTMSRSPSITIRFPIPWPYALGPDHRGPSRSSIKRKRVPPTCADPAIDATPPSPNTCPVDRLVPVGHRRASEAGPRRLEPIEILVDVIMRNRPRNRASAPVSASFASPRPPDRNGGYRLQRALEIDATSYSSVASILKNKPRPCTRQTDAGDRSPQYPRAILSLRRHHAAPSYPRPTQASKLHGMAREPSPN